MNFDRDKVAQIDKVKKEDIKQTMTDQRYRQTDTETDSGTKTGQPSDHCIMSVGYWTAK